MSELFKAKRIVIVGAGITGKSVARLLTIHECELAIFDDGDTARLSSELDALGVGLKVRPLAQWSVEPSDICVLSAGIPRSSQKIQEALASGVRILNEIDVALTFYTPERLVGITGTNGKSTTTTMLGAIISEAFSHAFVGGNLGTPFCEALFADRPDTVVVELSSYQLETLHSKLFTAVGVTNLAPDHLDRYESVEAYYQSKAHLFSLLKDEGASFVNADDDASRAHLKGNKSFGISGNDARLEGDTVFLGDVAITLDNPAIVGPHNRANAALALGLAAAIGVEPDALQRGIRSYAGIDHRLQRVGEHTGVTWFNDSKATNVAAASVALASFERGVHLIAGGAGKGSSYVPLVDAARGRLAGLYTIGDDASRLSQAFSDEEGLQIHDCKTLEVAAAKAQQEAQAGDVILLSPACASFDQFKNFKVRGDRFIALFNEKKAGTL